jgi:hypothetical protein
MGISLEIRERFVYFQLRQPQAGFLNWLWLLITPRLLHVSILGSSPEAITDMFMQQPHHHARSAQLK